MVRLALALMLLGGCLADGTSVPTGKSAVPLERLFAMDGCDVYRFYDGGYYHYIVKCASSVAISGHE